MPTNQNIVPTIRHKEALFSAMSHGATLITPNNRLSNQLLHDFFKQLNHPIIHKPNCLPYQTFLQDLYKKVRHLYANKEHPVLLSPQQQICLWQQVLSQSQEETNEGLLNEVQEAWTRCQLWQINTEDPAFLQTPQTRQFQYWCRQIETQLQALFAITDEQLVPHLLIYPELFNFNQIVWVCFDDYTPQQRALQQAIEAQGGKQHHYDLPKTPSTVRRYAAKDGQDERLQMIEWLKTKLNAGEKRIGVVIPDLQTQSHSLQRRLLRHLSPHQFDLSLGQPLSDYPLVAHAIQWLKLDKQTIRHHVVRLLLHSPYLSGSKNEFIARSEALQTNQTLQEPIIGLSSLLRSIQDSAPQLADLLNNMVDYPASAPTNQWIALFKSRLTQLGFPGEYPLTSSTYQCFQRFMSLFDEFLQLSIIHSTMSQTQALESLYNLAKRTIFQEKKPTSPIQVMGLLEASGCTFDSLWVCGLTDQCLPQKPRLSAFIPLNIQQEQLMPHATSLRELVLAQQLLQRLKDGSHDSLFSYPSLTMDSPNLPSPLILNVPLFTPQDITKETPKTYLIPQQESYVLPFGENETTSGGTALLANQAKCPFRAFAAHRLYAQAGLNITQGLDLGARGQIIHKIMELLWKDLGSQQQLLSLKTPELQQKIEQAILQTLAPIIKHEKLSFPPLIQDIESSRLYQLVNACMAWEKQRPPFTVEAIEQNFTQHLSGIDFRIRVDRIDKISSDHKWVIDYKTSLPTNKPWNEERPEAPQLLLYALLNPQINALIFIQLKTGRILCSGLSEEQVAVPGIAHLKKGDTWSQKQAEWHQQLSQLANEFRLGHCAPQPSRTSTCQQCDFPNLCRIESIY